jgi:predicted RecA/RadA family phage recombinase
MSRTLVHAGRRRTFTASVVNAAGDLVYQNGFFGVVQDTTVVGSLAAMILENVHELKNVFGSNIGPGTKIYAAPSVIATSLLLYPAASVPSGGIAIGRAWATSPASSATATLKVQLFNPNQY